MALITKWTLLFNEHTARTTVYMTKLKYCAIFGKFGHLTRPDPLNYVNFVTRLDPTRPAGQPDPCPALMDYRDYRMRLAVVNGGNRL